MGYVADALLLVHILAGFVALVVAPGAMVARKGGAGAVVGGKPTSGRWPPSR